MEPNKEKIDNVVLFLARNIRFLGKKKLAKLLYFIDFTMYELDRTSVTGLRYKKMQYGPMPVQFYSVLDDIEDRQLISVSEGGKPLHEITALQEPDIGVFTKDEEELIRSITEKYSNSFASEAERQHNLSHRTKW